MLLLSCPKYFVANAVTTYSVLTLRNQETQVFIKKRSKYRTQGHLFLLAKQIFPQVEFKMSYLTGILTRNNAWSVGISSVHSDTLQTQKYRSISYIKKKCKIVTLSYISPISLFIGSNICHSHLSCLFLCNALGKGSNEMHNLFGLSEFL